MAVVSIRALLRDAGAVFEGVERDQEPVLITRRGRPVAALVPVDPERAEAMLLSSVPEFVESRNRAENARAEGRTTPLEGVLRELDAEDAEGLDAQVASVVPASHIEFGDMVRIPRPDIAFAVGSDLAFVVGSERAQEIGQTVHERVQQITSDVLQSAVDADLVSLDEQRDLAPKIEVLNERMFNVRLRHELARRLSQGIAVIHGSPIAAGATISRSDGLLGETLTDAVLGDAASFVDSINTHNVEVSKRGGRLSPDIFEASLEASVSVLERSDVEIGSTA
jgi:prevent-host-death family protein